jgi:hypothetical protein
VVQCKKLNSNDYLFLLLSLSPSLFDLRAQVLKFSLEKEKLETREKEKQTNKKTHPVVVIVLKSSATIIKHSLADKGTSKNDDEESRVASKNTEVKHFESEESDERNDEETQPNARSHNENTETSFDIFLQKYILISFNIFKNPTLVDT